MFSVRPLFHVTLMLGTIVFAPIGASAQMSWEQVLPRVKQKCASDYPDDYSMQAFCVKQQHEGWLAVNGSDMPNSTLDPAPATRQHPGAGPATVADADTEARFIKTVAQYKAAYGNALNDMQKGALRPQRGRELCRIMPGVEVRNWYGTVHSLSSNNDGNGVIEIDLGNGVYVKTMNNSLSDSSYHNVGPLWNAAVQSCCGTQQGGRG